MDVWLSRLDDAGLRWPVRSSLPGLSARSAPVLPTALPASPIRDDRRRPKRLGCRRTLAAEVVLDADDIVDLGGRDLEDLDALDRLVAMDPADRDVGALARTQLALDDVAGVIFKVEQQAAGHDVDRFVLPFVALERQPLAGLDDEDLAAVVIGQGPDQLVAPGLGDGPAAVGEQAHEPRTSRSPASSICSRTASDVASV